MIITYLRLAIFHESKSALYHQMIKNKMPLKPMSDISAPRLLDLYRYDGASYSDIFSFAKAVLKTRTKRIFAVSMLILNVLAKQYAIFLLIYVNNTF